MSSQSHRDSVRGVDPAAQPRVRASGLVHAVCWTALISALLPVVWRIAMLCGADLGFPQAGFFRSNASVTAYILGLRVIQTFAGTLCLGLIYLWGERVPRWRPSLGSRRIPTSLPLVLERIGNALLHHINVTLIIRFGSIRLSLIDDRAPADGMNGWQVAILAVVYAPMLFLWVPTLTIGPVGYWRRRTTRQYIGSCATHGTMPKWYSGENIPYDSRDSTRREFESTDPGHPHTLPSCIPRDDSASSTAA